MVRPLPYVVSITQSTVGSTALVYNLYFCQINANPQLFNVAPAPYDLVIPADGNYYYEFIAEDGTANPVFSLQTTINEQGDVSKCGTPVWEVPLSTSLYPLYYTDSCNNDITANC